MPAEIRRKRFKTGQSGPADCFPPLPHLGNQDRGWGMRYPAVTAMKSPPYRNRAGQVLYRSLSIISDDGLFTRFWQKINKALPRQCFEGY